MNRKKFLKKGIVGLGAAITSSALISSCTKDEGTTPETESGDCDLSPRETAGPFPIKTPSELIQQNIIGDRSGIALLTTLTIQDQSDNCQPLVGAYVDFWQCDAAGHYSQYGGIQMQRTDYTNHNFLRGRQVTDSNGQVTFVTIFPGWYSSRAPHIHLEILDSNEKSLRVTQIAFPKDICDTVYATNGYNGEADTLNGNDNVFSDSVNGNMLESLTGNVNDGYTLLDTIVV